MIPAKLIKDLHEVPENVILEAVNWLEQQGVDEGSLKIYKRMLTQVKIFRHHGLEPVILANKSATSYCVTSRETLDSSKLH